MAINKILTKGVAGVFLAISLEYIKNIVIMHIRDRVFIISLEIDKKDKLLFI